MPPKRAPCKHIILSDEELASGITSLENIQAGVEEFHTNGIVIFENAIPHDILDKFYEKMNTDGAKRLEDPKVFFNHGNEKTNFSICPPLSKEWLAEDIWANKHASAVMEAVFGKPQLAYAGSNINLPAADPTSRQAVHVDSYHDHHQFPTCIELFMYLHDVSPTNGSTEIWPGSHRDYNLKNLVSHGRGWVKSSAFNRRAEHSPPFQPTMPKGSIAIRDLRLWHAGMPNLSDQNRIMLGFIYFPRWYRSPMRIMLPKNCKTVVQKWTQVDAVGATQFVDGEVDHLDQTLGTLAYLNFTQDPEMGIKQIRVKIDVEQGREPNAALEVTEKDYWVPERNRLSDRVTEEAEGKSYKGRSRLSRRGRGRGRGGGNFDALKPRGGSVKKRARK
ncbi:hypothetical protein BELL_0004g00520 [Botrytis elliptica]|uniref:Phytanoyl-CoA dioxygenase n=1 Tax=Botrytis elliptica TaxID=278938 RepID=A0A4Z1K402_9HELO|nr:hypothetical protein BELL_0004g00520 [Botrytis elliptica]